jgi:dihydroorotate dehydrogenase (NAD+) catalytic subunit
VWSRGFANDLPALIDADARVVVSIWGRSIDEYRRAAELLADAPSSVVAVEVNLSCPNLEGRRGIFAHDPDLSAEVIAATSGCGRPRWAKLSANTDRVVEVATAVRDAGAEAVTLINTLLGMVIDPASGKAALGAGGGGYSGRPIHAVAVRTVTSLPHFRTCRSSASAASQGDGTRSNWYSPAPARCRSEPPTSSTRKRRFMCFAR